MQGFIGVCIRPISGFAGLVKLLMLLTCSLCLCLATYLVVDKIYTLLFF